MVKFSLYNMAGADIFLLKVGMAFEMYWKSKNRDCFTVINFLPVMKRRKTASTVMRIRLSSSKKTDTKSCLRIRSHNAYPSGLS